MSFTKTVKATYHILEASSEDYFLEVSDQMKAIFKSGEASGSFDTSDAHFVWRINDVIELASTETFFISLVREKLALPVWFNDDGEIMEIPKNDGMIGELFYAYFNPKNKFVISMAATSGSNATAFKKFLNEFSKDMSVKLIPLFEDSVDKTVLNWGYYKKLALSINFPTHDDLAEFKTTKEGLMLPIIDEMGGLKIDVNISTSKPKQMLNAYQVKEVVSSMIGYELCSKIVVRGGDYESEQPEEIDIKNAQVKYTEKIIVQDSYIPLDEAKSLLLKAFDARSKELLNS